MMMEQLRRSIHMVQLPRVSWLSDLQFLELIPWFWRATHVLYLDFETAWD